MWRETHATLDSYYSHSYFQSGSNHRGYFFFGRLEGEIKGPISPVGTVSKAVGSQEAATALIIIAVMLKHSQ